MATNGILDDYYNAAADLINRNLSAGRADKIAFVDAAAAYTYGEVERLTNAAANLLTARGMRMEERILLCLLDTIDFPTMFLGAIKAGIVPIPVNTRLTASDYEYILADSRARALVVSDSLLPQFAPHLERHPNLDLVVVSGADGGGHERLADALAGQPDAFAVAPTRRDDICFWLYTSGTTGRPKGAVHLHTDIVTIAERYAIPTLALSSDDIIFSGAKLFFAYGLGNSLSFPMTVGASAILLAEPPTPKAVCDILRQQKPTIFCGVPTLFAMLLASNELPGPGEHGIRLATSAGEILPAELYRRFKARTGIDILDGLGSTEMLHIFLSNRRDDIRPGASGWPVDGYQVRLVNDAGDIVEGAGEIGVLEVSGPTAAVMYWNQRARSRATFLGEWTRSGDKYIRDDTGCYTFAGRADDMLKVGGIYVSPTEVEAAVSKHAKVLEVAVIGQPDDDGLVKPKAFVVLCPDARPSEALAEDIKEFTKKELASYKYPRWIQFMDELPKTATGKIQRYKLRELSS